MGSFRDIGDFAVSRNGVLAYRSGSDQNIQFTWLDRQGNTLDTVGNPGPFYSPSTLAVSPDGMRVATHRRDPQTGNFDIWVVDPARNTSTRLTSNPAIDVGPVWAPDASRIVFASNRDGPYNLYEKVSSGAGDEEALLKSNHHKLPQDWSRDGRFLLYADSDPNDSKRNFN